MTHKTHKRLLEKKAVLKRLLDSNPLQRQHTLLERLRIINYKLDIHKNHFACAIHADRQICGLKGGQR